MSIRFDAPTDQVFRSDTLPDPATAFTFTCWAYLSVDRNDYSTFFRTSNGLTTVNIATEADGTTLAYFTGGGSITSTHSLVEGAWTRVAATCTGTSGKIYGAAGVSGATSVTSGTVGGIASPNLVSIGGRGPGDPTDTYNGRIAYVRIWSVVLSQTQIEAEWQSTKPIVISGLLWADWRLPTASDLTDYSGNARHLTAGSTSVTTEADPPIHNGSVAVSLGALSVTVVGGARNITGTVAVALGTLSTSIVGYRSIPGAVIVNLSGLSVVIVGSQSETIVTAGGGWNSLLTILREIHSPETVGQVACPIDGEPLSVSSKGDLYCRFDGWKP